MEIANKVRGARGFVTIGNGIGETINMDKDTQLHPAAGILKDLAAKGMISAVDKTVSVDQLNFSNLKNNTMTAQVEQNMTTRRNIER